MGRSAGGITCDAVDILVPDDLDDDSSRPVLPTSCGGCPDELDDPTIMDDSNFVMAISPFRAASSAVRVIDPDM
eukprot:11576018-Heterocapsa_arctica.AAC.1